MVHRTGGGLGVGLRPLQRHVGRALLPGDHGARRRRCSTTTTTATSTSTSCRARCSARQDAEPGHVPAEWRAQGSAVPQRSRRERGRDAHAALHGRDRARAASTSRPTAWAWRPATSTTTGSWTSTAPASTARVLLRNNGNGTFTDVTRQTGTEDRGGWGVSAAFVDYDRDGWLDLFVGNYLIYSLDGDVDCLSVTGQRDYCPPNSYRAAAEPALSQPRQRHVRRRHAQGARRRRLRPGARRLDRRLQRRRLDRHLRRQRRRAQPALDQPAERHVQGHGVHVRRRRERRRQRGSQHGHRRRRLRQRRRRGPVHHQLARADEHPLRQRRHAASSKTAKRRRRSVRRAWPRPVSAPPGSTTTTTRGSICSRPTAAWRPSRRRPGRRIPFRSG